MCGGETDCDDSVYSLTNECADTSGSQTTYSIEMVIGNDVTEETNTCYGFNTVKLNARFPVDDCPIWLDDVLQA